MTSTEPLEKVAAIRLPHKELCSLFRAHRRGAGLTDKHCCPALHATDVLRFAYCLLHDHLHLLIRIREEAGGSLYKPFAMLFNSYTKGYNKHNGKEGRVFKFKLKRVEIRNTPYFLEMIRYINQNPWRHGETEHPANYRFSSFRATMTTGPTLVAKDKVQEYFGSHENLSVNLLTRVDESAIRLLMLED